MPDPIRIRSGSAWKHWPEAGRMILAHRLAIRLAKTWHKEPELNRIRAGFAQYYPGRLWKNGNELESGELVAGRLCPARNWVRWFLHTGLISDQMRLAKPWLGHPDRIPVSFVQYDPCLLWKKRAETDAGSRIRHILSGPIMGARWP